MASKVKTKVQTRAVATARAPSTELTTADDLSDEELIKMHGGVGVSTDAADNLVPMMTVLQGLSPQVMKKNEAYIKDAEPGDILLKNAPDPLIKGDDGFLFQPCYYSYDWVLWRPRNKGGGFMGRHSSTESNPPAGTKQVEDQENGRLVWRNKEGNEWIFTRYFSGYVLRAVPMPFVIPFKSTGHTVAKQWNFALNNMEMPNVTPATKAPIYGGSWRCTTKHRSNAEGEWYVLEPKIEHMFHPRKEAEAYARGLRLRNSFLSGATKIEEPEQDDVGGRAAPDEDGEM